MRRGSAARLLGLALGLAGMALALGTTTCWFDVATPYRGWTGLTLPATGRFRLASVGGIWWFVTPDGHPFFSTGVDVVSPRGDYAPDLATYPYHDNVLARWGSEAAWADATIDRLDGAGLNTIGAWSQLDLFRGRFPYCEILSFASAAPVVPDTGGGLATPMRDFYAPAFADAAPGRADGARACAADPFCIGVFSDNELPWGPGLNQSLHFADAYMKLPAGAPGKLALQAFFEERYGGDVAAFDAAWGLDLPSFDAIQDRTDLGSAPTEGSDAARADRLVFAGRVAERYFHVVHDALRAVDPELLILGARFLAYSTPAVVAEAAAPWVDALSVNAYEYEPGWFAVAQALAARAGGIPAAAVLDDVDAMYRMTGKPVLVSEYGYRAADAGLPNSHPPVYPILPDQQARAEAWQRYVAKAAAQPGTVGVHLFQYMDEPATGRFDGEDDNFGLVDIEDDLYRVLYVHMWALHAGLYPMRAALGAP